MAAQVDTVAGSEQGAGVDVTAWLLDSDPSVRWQVQRDLLDEPPSVWTSTRASVEHAGVAADLLAARDEEGTWAHAAFWPRGFSQELWRSEGQAWTATAFVLAELVDLGLRQDWSVAPDLVEAARRLRWEHDGQPFWEGEVEECINARLVTVAAALGVDVAPVVDDLLSKQQPDGGWNCERERGSTVSSFDSAINVVEALLAHEVATGASTVAAARASGEEWLLARGLVRGLRSGEVADPDYLLPTHPPRWQHDVLRGLDHLRAADRHDPRLAEAVSLLESLRLPDGRWPLSRRIRGRAWASYGEPGEPSPWLTLKALRVLRWWYAD